MATHGRGCPAIRVVMMPRDTNPHGTIFGGVLLSYLDQAGAICAREQAPRRYVTVAIEKVEFHQPVLVGDVLSFFTTVRRVGRTSLTIQVSVEADRFADPSQVVAVTEATITYVAVDEQWQPVPHGLRPTAGPAASGIDPSREREGADPGTAPSGDRAAEGKSVQRGGLAAPPG
jgi:acyl-CoA thioesterase YciA